MSKFTKLELYFIGVAAGIVILVCLSIIDKF